MGRDTVLPKKIFGHISPTKGNPIYNVWIAASSPTSATHDSPVELAAEIVTFGALIAFMGVNLVSLLHSPSARATPASATSSSMPSSQVLVFVLLCDSGSDLAELDQMGRHIWLCRNSLRRLQNERLHSPPQTLRLQRNLDSRFCKRPPTRGGLFFSARSASQRSPRLNSFSISIFKFLFSIPSLISSSSILPATQTHTTPDPQLRLQFLKPAAPIPVAY